MTVDHQQQQTYYTRSLGNPPPPPPNIQASVSVTDRIVDRVSSSETAASAPSMHVGSRGEAARLDPPPPAPSTSVERSTLRVEGVGMRVPRVLTASGGQPALGQQSLTQGNSSVMVCHRYYACVLLSMLTIMVRSSWFDHHILCTQYVHQTQQSLLSTLVNTHTHTHRISPVYYSSLISYHCTDLVVLRAQWLQGRWMRIHAMHNKVVGLCVFFLCFFFVWAACLSAIHSCPCSTPMITCYYIVMHVTDGHTLPFSFASLSLSHTLWHIQHTDMHITQQQMYNTH